MSKDPQPPAIPAADIATLKEFAIPFLDVAQRLSPHATAFGQSVAGRPRNGNFNLGIDLGDHRAAIQFGGIVAHALNGTPYEGKMTGLPSDGIVDGTQITIPLNWLKAHGHIILDNLGTFATRELPPPCASADETVSHDTDRPPYQLPLF